MGTQPTGADRNVDVLSLVWLRPGVTSLLMYPLYQTLEDACTTESLQLEEYQDQH